MPKLNVKVISDPFSPKRFYETFLFLGFFFFFVFARKV